MVKTNAERQAEYRLRQREAGDKKRLNIWLSSRAHNELNTLAKRKGVSQQVLIEWLLTKDSLWKEEGSSLEGSAEIPAAENAGALLRNGSEKEGGDKKRIKKERVNKLLRNSASEVDIRKSGKQPDHAEPAPPLPLPAQFEFTL